MYWSSKLFTLGLFFNFAILLLNILDDVVLSKPYTFLFVGETRDLTLIEAAKVEVWREGLFRMIFYWLFSKWLRWIMEITLKINNHWWGWNTLFFTTPGLTSLDKAICFKKSNWSILHIRIIIWGCEVGVYTKVWLSALWLSCISC